jgi:tetratricopeptide (TPR) repeat protein
MKVFILHITFILCAFFSVAQETELFSVEEMIRRGNYSEARTILLSSGHMDSINYLSSLGEVNLRLGRLEEAEEILRKALHKLEDSADKNIELYSNALNRFALVLWNQGQDAEAQSYMHRTIDIRNRTSPDNSKLLAASYNDLGLITARTNPLHSLTSYEKALNLYKETYGKLSEKYAQGLINSGIIYSQLGSYDEATTRFSEAEKIVRNLYPNGHPTIAFILANTGKNFKAMGMIPSAMKAFNEALSLYQRNYGKKHPEVANIYNLIDQILMEQNKYDEALMHFQKALIANAMDFTSENTTSYPSLDDYYQPYTFLSSFLYKARTYQQMHFNKTLKIRHLKEGS